MKNMKIISIFLALFFLPSVAMAGQCPMLVAKVDEQLAVSKLSDEKKSEIQMLRNEAQMLHKNGDHATSEQLLAEALELLKG